MSKHKPDKARLESKDQAHAAIEMPPVKLIQRGGHVIRELDPQQSLKQIYLVFRHN